MEDAMSLKDILGSSLTKKKGVSLTHKELLEAIISHYASELKHETDRGNALCEIIFKLTNKEDAFALTPGEKDRISRIATNIRHRRFYADPGTRKVLKPFPEI